MDIRGRFDAVGACDADVAAGRLFDTAVVGVAESCKGGISR